eukprot:3343633-Lingulodinium_polyedra.AAC.1
MAMWTAALLSASWMLPLAEVWARNLRVLRTYYQVTEFHRVHQSLCLRFVPGYPLMRNCLSERDG